MTTTQNTLTAGLHDAIPASVYHADPCPEPSLSSGVARVMVDQTPAHVFLEHVRLGGHKSEPTPEMVFGNYVHGLLSGDLDEFVVGNFDNFLSKAAKEWRDEQKLAGKTPILEKNVECAEATARALREKAAIDVTNSPFVAGKPEVTAIWTEEAQVLATNAGGVSETVTRKFWFRARFDRLVLDEGAFADIWDWKTTGVGVSDEALLRIIIDKGYHIQAAHYLRGLRTLAPRFAGRTSFIFAFVETEAPFAVRRVHLSEGFLQLGDALLNRAIRRWQDSLANNKWPDDSSQSLTVEPPAWYSMRVMERSAA